MLLCLKIEGRPQVTSCMNEGVVGFIHRTGDGNRLASTLAVELDGGEKLWFASEFLCRFPVLHHEITKVPRSISSRILADDQRKRGLSVKC
jgi:hypothetical protein